MDFGLIIFLIFAWFIFSNVRAAGKGIAKASKKSGVTREQLSDIQAKVKAAQSNEFETSPERRDEWKDDALGGSWQDMTPTQRGRERARQKKSYPGSKLTLQQRLDAANYGQRAKGAHKGQNRDKKYKAFKQGSERKVKARQAGRGEDYGLSRRHAPQKDQNRHRRDDWGQRGGAEILSTRNLLIGLALGFIVLYVLSKVSPSDLGL